MKNRDTRTLFNLPHGPTDKMYRSLIGARIRSGAEPESEEQREARERTAVRRRQRDAAIDRGADRARKETPEFYAAAAKAIVSASWQFPTFTTDEVWALIPADAMPTDKRAMAWAMRNAAKEGLIEATDNWALSKEAACHARPKRVWRRI